MNNKGMIATLIAAFMVLLIGFSFLPTIAEQMNVAQAQVKNSTQNSDAPIFAKTIFAKTILGLIPLFFALAVILSAFAIAYSALSRGFSDYEEENKDIPEEERPHKQTYLEYVKERMSVEKLTK
jgi:Na+/proline symporter